MTRDLARELRLLAEAAPVDDHGAGLLGARAHGMVARIRRRRARRRGATAALSVAAATIAVLGLPPTHGLEEPPANAPQETSGLTTSTTSDACGRTLHEIGWADAGPARLAARAIGAYTSGRTGMSLRFALASTAGATVSERPGAEDGPVTLTSLERPEAVVLSDDGRVIGVPVGAPDYVRMTANTDGGALLASGKIALTMRSCDGEDTPVPAGTHSLRLRQTGTLHIEGQGSTPITAVSRPVAITFPVVGNTSPTCGDTFDLAPSGEPVEISLTSALPGALRAGEVVDFDLDIIASTTPAYISVQGFAAGLVFVQDGVAVGGGSTPLIGGEVEGVTGATARGQGAAVGCDGQPLPPGEYTVYPVLDAEVTRILAAEPPPTEPVSTGGVATLVAEPLTIRVP